MYYISLDGKNFNLDRGGNCRHMNREMPTLENPFLTLFWKSIGKLEKDIPVLEKSKIYALKDMNVVTVFH